MIRSTIPQFYLSYDLLVVAFLITSLSLGVIASVKLTQLIGNIVHTEKQLCDNERSNVALQT